MWNTYIKATSQQHNHGKGEGEGELWELWEVYGNDQEGQIGKGKIVK